MQGGGSLRARASGSSSHLCWGVGGLTHRHLRETRLRPRARESHDQSETELRSAHWNQTKTGTSRARGGGWRLAVLETQRTEMCQPWKGGLGHWVWAAHAGMLQG